MGSILHFVFRIDTIIMIGLSAQWSSLLRSETINFTRNWLLDFLNLFTNSCSGSLPRQAHPDPLIFGAGGKSRPSTWGSLAWSSVLHTSAVKDVEVTTVKFPLLFQIARVKSKVQTNLQKQILRGNGQYFVQLGKTNACQDALFCAKVMQGCSEENRSRAAAPTPDDSNVSQWLTCRCGAAFKVSSHALFRRISGFC